VLVVCADIQQSDRLVEELFGIGLEPSPAFSAGEAVGLLGREPFDAVVVDGELEEELMALRRWLSSKYRGVIVLTREGDSGTFEVDDGGAMNEGLRVTARVLKALGQSLQGIYSAR